MINPGRVAVSLRAMTPEEFAAWRPRSIEAFAEDLARAMERPLEGARARAQAQFDEALPNGLDTPDTWLMVILDEVGTEVGTLWLARHPQRPGAAFVYDIEIHEAARRRGYGRAAMLAAEDVVRAAGFGELGLSVFGFNESAKQLYDSLGYRVINTQMTKRLVDEQN